MLKHGLVLILELVINFEFIPFFRYVEDDSNMDYGLEYESIKNELISADDTETSEEYDSQIDDYEYEIAGVGGRTDSIE